MNQQIMNYIRGKVFEILIVGGTSFIAFTVLDLRYAACSSCNKNSDIKNAPLLLKNISYTQ